jgi:uncharacterized protein (DUF488 family)
MKLFTIGFTETSAEDFFGRLMRSGVKTVVDVRLNNTSQLAGFAKARDLAYFLQGLGGIGYVHQPLLLPTADMLSAYRSGPGTRSERWSVYQERFIALMGERRIEERIDPMRLDRGCLLCSEAKPHHCHRRLVAEYLAEHWKTPLQIEHL